MALLAALAAVVVVMLPQHPVVREPLGKDLLVALVVIQVKQRAAVVVVLPVLVEIMFRQIQVGLVE
jgi:hypothetical protein